MRTKYILVSALLLLSVLLAACGSQATPPPNVVGAVSTAADTAATAVQEGAVSTLAASTEVQGVQTEAVQDLNTLVTALGVAGVTVESAETIQQPFFTVPGQALKVNGQDLQVYVYDTSQAMEAEAAQVSADGSTIGTSMPSWMDDPHFYKAGRLMVLYIGQDQKILDILSGIFGPQFAGR